MKKYKNFLHVIPIQIRFSDVDRLQHVNNACYLNFFELGRVSYFRDVFKTSIDWDKEGFILARTEINHLKPLYLNDDVYCCTKVSRFGNKSMVMQNIILKMDKGKPVECAEGIGVMVAMNYTTEVSKKIPIKWRKAVEVFEGKG